MSHQIENEQIAYTGETPWHGIGARLEPGATPEEFLKAAKLDWTVEQHPLFADVNGKTVRVKDKFALVRDSDDKVLTITGKSWHPVQNSAIVDFMQRYCAAGGAEMETAGALRDGQIVWGLAKLNHSFSVRKGDIVNGYLLFTCPHLVGNATTIRTTQVRVVCANTMAMADRSSTVEYSQNHLTEFDMDSAKEAVENAHEALRAAEKRAKTIDKLKLNLEDAMKKVVVPVFDPDLAKDEDFLSAPLDPDSLGKRLSAILDSIQTGPGATPETGWGVLNGVTHYCDHVGGVKPDTRLYRSWVGDYSRNKLAVEKRLLELAGSDA